MKTTLPRVRRNEPVPSETPTSSGGGSSTAGIHAAAVVAGETTTKTRFEDRGLTFEHAFSKPGIHPFDEIEWDQRTAEITDDSGKAIFKQENVEVPKSWSALATKIAVSKYFYGDIAHGTDPDNGGRESSVRQLIHRVTRTIADCGIKDGYFADARARREFLRRTDLALRQPIRRVQLARSGSTSAFTTNTASARTAARATISYNRTTGQAERAATQYEYPQGSACFIQAVDDNMEDIMRLARSEAMLFKYGSAAPAAIFPRCVRPAKN